MFKRTCLVILALAVILPLGNVFAEKSETKIGKYNDMYYVRGQLEASELSFGDRLTVLMKDNQNNIKYINETEVNADGSYSLAFECENADGNNNILVKAGSTDVSDSTCYAGTFEDIIDASIVKTADKKNIKIFAEVINPYLMEQNYTMLAAEYDSSGKLKSVKTKNESLIGKSADNKYLFTFESENTSRVALMVFESLSNIVPLCKSFPADDFEALLTETDVFYNRYEVEDSKHNTGFREELMNGGRALTKTNKSGYFVLENVDMTDVKSGIINAGSTIENRKLEVRLDRENGKKIGEVTLNTTETQFTLKTTEFKINAADVATEKNHNIYFVDNSKNTDYTVDFVILTNEKTSEESGAGAPTYVNNTDQNIVHTGEWKNKTGDFYQGGDAAVLTGEGSIKYEFYGTGVDLICDVTQSDCNIDIYIDGIKEKTQNLKNLLNSGKSAPARTVFTKTGLKRWKHTIEIKSQSGGVTFDAFKVYTRPIRVVCVGDSITDGGHKGEKFRNQILDKEFSWPHEMNKILGGGYMIFNCGKGGICANNYDNADVYVFKTAKSEDADVVINTLGYNDYGLKDFKAESFKERFVYIMNEIKKTCTTTPRLYIGLTPFGTENTAKDSKRIAGVNALKELSSEKNWPIVDFLDYMAPYRDNGKYFPDATHPYTYEANNMMAAIAAGQLPCAELCNPDDLKKVVENCSKKAE